MEILLFWVGLAVVVAIAANTRGRNPGAWFVLAVVVSPLLAGLLLLASRNLREEEMLGPPGEASIQPSKLWHSPMLGGRSSRVTIDRQPAAFEAEGIFEGIPYRIAPDGSIDAVMQGARVKFRDIDVFMSQVGPTRTER